MTVSTVNSRAQCQEADSNRLSDTQQQSGSSSAVSNNVRTECMCADRPLRPPGEAVFAESPSCLC
jgi:hypothetical protein